MPKFDEYGTQQPNALLKLLLEKNGMYQRNNEELDFMTIRDVLFVSAMAPPGFYFI
jgi:dynein heavy chain, axonemal